MAPEVFKCTEPYDGRQSDVWSLGVCLFAMLCGMVPFKGRNIHELKDSIVEDKLKFPTEIESKLSKEAKHLVRIMLRKDYKKRVTLEKVLMHPWLKDTPKKLSIFKYDNPQPVKK